MVWNAAASPASSCSMSGISRVGDTQISTTHVQNPDLNVVVFSAFMASKQMKHRLQSGSREILST